MMLGASAGKPARRFEEEENPVDEDQCLRAPTQGWRWKQRQWVSRVLKSWRRLATQHKVEIHGDQERKRLAALIKKDHGEELKQTGITTTICTTRILTLGESSMNLPSTPWEHYYLPTVWYWPTVQQSTLGNLIKWPTVSMVTNGYNNTVGNG